MSERVDFDHYAERYEELLQNQLGFFSSDRGYFSDYKVSLMRAGTTKSASRILDFGCGIGLTLPYLKKYFPDAVLHATDISSKSLERVAARWPGVQIIMDDELDKHRFDLILVAGVLHHVPVPERLSVLSRLGELLTHDGEVFVFEHNPFNPVTCRLVSACPFDADAVLISMRHLLNLMRSSRVLNPCGSGYCLFFPECLQPLRPIETALRWLPLGGQYFVRATKT